MPKKTETLKGQIKENTKEDPAQNSYPKVIEHSLWLHQLRN